MNQNCDKKNFQVTTFLLMIFPPGTLRFELVLLEVQCAVVRSHHCLVAVVVCPTRRRCMKAGRRGASSNCKSYPTHTDGASAATKMRHRGATLAESHSASPPTHSMPLFDKLARRRHRLLPMLAEFKCLAAKLMMLAVRREVITKKFFFHLPP